MSPSANSDLRTIDPSLVAYVDGELDAAGVAAVERRLAEDQAARDDVEMLRTTAMLLRAACSEDQYAQPPLRPLARPPGLRLPRRAAGLMAAGLLLTLAGFGGGSWWRGEAGGDLLGEIAEYHAVITQETTHLAEFAPDQASQWVGWLGRRVGRRLSVPDLQSAGMRFAGGRMLVIDGEPVADFLYVRDGGKPVAVCVARSDAAGSELRIDQRGRLRLGSWTQAGTTYVVVGELDADAARRLAHLVASQIDADPPAAPATTRG